MSAIVYLDTSKAEGGSVCPPWLDGWSGPIAGKALCRRHSDRGTLVGVSDPLLFDLPRRLSDVDDRWKVGALGADINHGVLARDLLWCDVKPVQDMRERVWMAPVILTPNGERAFRVAYGSNWLPALTPEQERAESVAKAARDALAGGGAEMAVACQWAAELLSITYHLHPQVIAALAMLDDRLVPEVLGAAAGYELEVVRNGN